jgi:hypothetical protein
MNLPAATLHPSPVTSPPLSQAELELRRIRELTKGRRHAEACAAAEALAVTVPENRDVRYLIAVNQRSPKRSRPWSVWSNSIRSSAVCTRSAVIATWPSGMRSARSTLSGEA